MSFQKDDLNLHGLARVNMFLRQEAFNKENPKEEKPVRPRKFELGQKLDLD